MGKFHTRIEGRDFSPTELRVIYRLVETIVAEYKKAWQGIYPVELEYQRSEMQPQFANIATPSEIVVATNFTLEVGETSGSIHFCVPYSTLEPIRDVLYSTIQGDSAEPDRRWVNLLKQQIQSAEVDLVAELATRRRHGGTAAGLQAGRLHRAGPGPDDPGQDRRRAGLRLPLRHVQQALLDQDRQAHFERPGGLDRRTSTMAAEDALPMSEEDKMAAEWAAALAESKPESGSGNEVASEVSGPAETVAPATFTNFSPTGVAGAGNDLSMILDIPVQLTVELGRTRIPIKHILQLAQGSVVELETMAGEPMDVLVNGYLIAQGEVVVVNDKFGIRLTDIVTPSERMRRLSARN
jgi:flagellar motor switch protein FliN